MTDTAVEVRERFTRDGYLVVPDLLDRRIFDGLFRDWQGILDGIVDGLLAEGRISSRYDDLPFEQRLLAVSSESKQVIARPFDITLPLRNITTETPFYVGPGIFDILTASPLLDLVEQLIGPEIVSNPTQHVRMKPPSRLLSGDPRDDKLSGGGGAPFHQDQGVVLEEADNSEILTCWIAVTDADEENGCLYVYPGTGSGELIPHCPADAPAMQQRGVQGIPDRLLPTGAAKPLPLKSGGALFFNRKLVHGSYDNASTDRLRISLDLRFQRPGEPTGRPEFPPFVARSRSHSETELRDAEKWADTWYETRERLARDGTPRFYRWSADAEACA